MKHALKRWTVARPLALGAGVILATLAGAHAAPADPERAQFRDFYKEILETDSSAASGSCTAVAEKARARLLAAGYPQGDTEIVLAPGLPLDGNLVASLPGTDPAASPILLLAHIDVVNAKASDWKRDPFRLVEENGYFYARGAVDDKAMAAIFVDSLVHFRREGFRPKRTIKLALTCGEESGGRLRGIRYLIAHRPETVKAAFAINEGGSGYLDADGRPRVFSVEAGQKVYQDYHLTATGPGAHSSRPGKDNVITRMSAALVRLGGYRFPADISPVTRRFFARSAALQTGAVAADMRALGAGSNDPAVIDRVAGADPVWNAMIRTTCVATMMNAGHAKNALAQSADVNVNCRILPGEDPQAVQARLTTVIADPSIAITLGSPPAPRSIAPALTPEILGPIEHIAAQLWPGVPVIPSVAPGATDGRFLTEAGTPTYGVSGIFLDPDGNGIHGLDERVRVESLYNGRIFLYRLVKDYAAG
ncbi:M20/M25/M40 family metallo-hydrolase [Gluconacetobacter sp. Hr-1-5]|uniref:M20/M25/M40 family metallo-hydrolase n=1 Tax=Gluconacetobacter sp. Hr-1-5 TaxID=3395370 RepID=UPI003B51E875